MDIQEFLDIDDENWTVGLRILEHGRRDKELFDIDEEVDDIDEEVDDIDRSWECRIIARVLATPGSAPTGG